MKTIMQTSCGDCLYAPMCKKSTVYTHNSDYGETISRLENPEGYYMSICSEFEDKSQYIKLPCKLGDRCYHVTKYRSISDCTVSAIHYGRPLKQKGSEYIVLRSTNTGYVSDKLSFKDFQENVYFTREKAEKALKEVKENDSR